MNQGYEAARLGTKKPRRLTPWQGERRQGNTTKVADQTQPVGFGRPATLQAPFAGPDGNSS